MCNERTDPITPCCAGLQPNYKLTGIPVNTPGGGVYEAVSMGEPMGPRGGGKVALSGAMPYDFLVGREPGIAVHGIALCRWAFGVAKLDGIMLVDRAQKATVLLTRNCTVYSTGARRHHGERGRASEFPT